MTLRDVIIFLITPPMHVLTDLAGRNDLFILQFGVRVLNTGFKSMP